MQNIERDFVNRKRGNNVVRSPSHVLASVACFLGPDTHDIATGNHV